MQVQYHNIQHGLLMNDEMRLYAQKKAPGKWYGRLNLDIGKEC